MELAFTAPNDDRPNEHDTVLVIKLDSVPVAGHHVEIDNFVYEVVRVDWHFSTRMSDGNGYSIGDHDDTIVRMKKVGPA